MRALLLVAFALLAAGCVQQPADTPPTTTTPDDGMTTPDLPEDFEDSRAIQGGDIASTATGTPCQAPTANCVRYPFTLNSTATVSVTLTWGTPANDLDLYVMQDGVAVEGGTSGSPPPGTQEQVMVDLDAGDYEIVVVPYAVPQDTFTISVTFS